MTPELRELLELSAKAMGYEVMPPQPIDGEWIWCGDGQGRPFTWLPHRDKAQCFDIKCELRVDIDWWEALGSVQARKASPANHISIFEKFSDHDGDHAKAHMIAVLRVAAEIGRRMQC